MELYILDSNLEAQYIIDEAESVIWAERYIEEGDFEIYARPTEKVLAALKIGHYVRRADSDMVGMIRKVEVTSDPEDGSHIIASGPDLKSILGRRVVWPPLTLEGSTESVIRKLVQKCIIAPTDSARRIPNFILGSSIGLTDTISAQYVGDNLEEIVIQMLKNVNVGWKVTLTENAYFHMQFFQGADRTFAQNVNPYVTFSPDFDNLQGVSYIMDGTTQKTTAIVGGEGEGVSRKSATVGDTSAGLERMELFVDGSSLSVNTDTGMATEAQYLALLKESGNQQLQLAENGMVKTMEGEVNMSSMYQYGTDYGLGDIVNVQNEFGATSYARITEMVENEAETGRVLVPKFETVEVF